MEVGNKLKEAREAKGLSIKDIQQQTKIRKKYLIALENNEFDEIPGQVYVKAFIKGYAQAVGLKTNDLLQEYEAWKEALQRKKEFEEQSQEDEMRKTFFQNEIFKVILIVVSIILVVFVVYNFFFTDRWGGSKNTAGPKQVINNVSVVKNNDKSQEIKKDLEQESNTNAKTKVETITHNSAEMQKTNEKENETAIKIIASEKSWLQVTIDGQGVFQGFIDQGQVKEYYGQSKVDLKIGNGKAIKLKINDEIYGPWGESGEVVKKIIKIES